MVDGGLHAAELRGLDVQHLQDIVGQCVDQVGYAGQRLGGVVLGLLQRPLLVWRLKKRNGYLTFKRHDLHFMESKRCRFYKVMKTEGAEGKTQPALPEDILKNADFKWATFTLQDSCIFCSACCTQMSLTV